LNGFEAFLQNDTKEIRKQKRKRRKKNMKTGLGIPFSPALEAAHGHPAKVPKGYPLLLFHE
jgi:hypothetical protein